MQTGNEGVRSGSEETGSEAQPGGLVEEKEVLNEDKPSKENTRQTLERVAAELEAKSGEEQKDEPGDTGKEATNEIEKREPKETAPNVQKSTPVDELSAPYGLKAEAKEKFNKLDPELKKDLNRLMSEGNAKFTRSQQEVAEIKKNLETEIAHNRHLYEAIKPFRHAWAERKITDAQAILALASSQAKIVDPDPEVAVAELYRICKNRGVDFDAFAQYAKSKESGQAGNGQSAVNGKNASPEISHLLNEFNSLKQEIKSREEQEFQALVNYEAQNIEKELNALFNEQDASGKYIYPEFHDESFLKQAEQLVLSLVQTNPEISDVDAFKRAYFLLTGNSAQASNAARLPNSNNQQVKERAQRAAISVRGSGSSSNMSINDDIPKEALRSPRATLEYRAAQLQRGG